ncbi:hypothetical protein ACGTN6_20635 [Halomonas sp. THAF12]|uniref:hypothetical protein n=1 Tax=Halomonas sp. B23F22_10 TaxID=3459515 RepID=UPI00373E016E
MKKVFKICHFYDSTDNAVYVAAEASPAREAVYCQFVAENHYGESATVLNAGIALALTEKYGCDVAEPCDDAIKIDMYDERERLCGDGYHELMADPSLHREGLTEVFKDLVEI